MGTQLLPLICRLPNPDKVYYNLNTPDVDKMPLLRRARLGRIDYSIRVEEDIDTAGETFLSIGGKPIGFDGHPESDVALHKKGFATITPLSIDCVDISQYKLLQSHFD